MQALGEVFTPKWMVDFMLDQVGDLKGLKVLEPSAGEGAFLVEILRRKLSGIDEVDEMLAELKTIYGIEIDTENVKIARRKMAAVFCECYRQIFDEELDMCSKLFIEVQNVIHSNIIEGDAIDFFDSLSQPFEDLFAEVKEPLIKLNKADLKNAFIIGNPPYQEINSDSTGNYAKPIYHKFLEESYKVSDKVTMIHPARFLFNAGATPKDFNER